MCFRINCCLRVIRCRKAILALHQFCNCPFSSISFLIALILCKALTGFFQLFFDQLFCQSIRVFFQLFPLISIIKDAKALFNVAIKSFVSVTQLIFCKVFILELAGIKLTAIIRYNLEIRFNTSKHPLSGLYIYFSALRQFSGGFDSIIVPINVKLEGTLRIIRWSALPAIPFTPKSERLRLLQMHL